VTPANTTTATVTLILLYHRYSVTNVLKHWVEHYYRDFEESTELLSMLSQFVSEHLMSQYKAVALRINQLIHKRPYSVMPSINEDEIQVMTKLGACPFLEFDVLEVAKQLTIIDFTRFKSIAYSEFLRYYCHTCLEALLALCLSVS
jgi:hypothetical protein